MQPACSCSLAMRVLPSVFKLDQIKLQEPCSYSSVSSERFTRGADGPCKYVHFMLVIRIAAWEVGFRGPTIQ
jgi:hypothetical protein